MTIKYRTTRLSMSNIIDKKGYEYVEFLGVNLDQKDDPYSCVIYAGDKPSKLRRAKKKDACRNLAGNPEYVGEKRYVQCRLVVAKQKK